MSDKPKTPEREDHRKDMPAAGPHATPEQTNPDATPNAGSLPDETQEGDADGGVG